MRKPSWKAIIAALIASACSGESTAPLPALSSITVTLSSPTIDIAQTSQASATLRDATGNGFVVQGDTVKWTTANPGIATLSSNGLVTAVSRGTVLISASLLGKTGTALLTVAPASTPQPVAIASVDVILGASSIIIGQTALATATPKDDKGNAISGRAIAWSSSDPGVATVSPTGVIKGAGVGTALISASSDGKVGSATISVTPTVPNAVSSVAVSLAKSILSIGDYTQGSVVLKDSGGTVLTSRSVVWSSSNTDVATVSQAGYVSAIAYGTSAISAGSEGKLGSATVTVPTPVISRVTVVVSTSVAVGTTTQASALAMDTSGAPYTGVFSWASANPLIASVTSSGLVRGVAPGTAGISATAFGVSGNSQISVTSVTSAASRLSVATQPSGAASGVDLAAQPVVQIMDASNSVVVSATVPVTATIASGNGTLSGGTTVTSVNGIATFANLRLTGSGQFTLQFTTTAPGLAPTTSSSFTVTQTPTALAIQTQPGGAVNGANFTIQPIVQIRDLGNIVVSGSTAGVTASVASGSGTLSGTTVVSAVNGLATFTDLRVSGTGPHTLKFIATALTPATSASFTVGPSPSSLAIRTQPAGAMSGVDLTTQPVVEVRDLTNSVVPGSTAAVTASIASGTGTLSGTTTVTAVNGVVTFTTLRVSGSGPHTLQFSSGALAPTTSSTFTVMQAFATLAIQTQPGGAVSGVNLTTQPVVEVRDASNAIVVSSAVAVAASIVSGTGSLVGTTTILAVNGVARFTDLRINGGGAHSLQFTTTAPSVSTGPSTAFTVLQTPAALTVLVQPAGAVTGAPLAAQPVLEIRDNAGLVIANSTLPVSVAVTTGSAVLIGSATINAVGGVATFTNLRLDGVGMHVLTFSTSSPALQVSSNAFGVAIGAPAQLIIRTQPSDGSNGVALATQPSVEVRDVANQLVSTSVLVTAAIASGTGGLAGTASVNTVSGIATFSGLGINGGGTHTLKFAIAAPPLVAISNAVTITQVSALSRDGGSTAGGAIVRIAGNGFGSGDIVKFGANSATGVSLIDAFTLQAVAPAGTVGTVSVSVVHSGVTAIFSNAWTYWPAPTNVFGSADFEDGTFGAFGPCCTVLATGDSVYITTAVAHSGIRSVKQVAGSSAINDVAIGGGRVQDDIVGGPGRYHRWYFMAPAATLASTANNGQIKLFLSRSLTSGVNHFVVLGTGAEFRDPNPSQDGPNVLAANVDQFNGHINDKPPGPGIEPKITPDVWHEIQVYEYRDPVAHLGYAKIWYDGKLIGSKSDALLGDDDPTRSRGFQFGLVYTQNALSYPLAFYVDDVKVANGYIDPP